VRLLRDCGLLSFWGESRLRSVYLTVHAPEQPHALNYMLGGILPERNRPMYSWYLVIA